MDRHRLTGNRDYQVESFASWMDEARPLFAAHWNEIANYKDSVPLNFDYDFYLKIESEGGLLPVTARKDGRLIGYALFMLIRLGHYKHIKCAHNDALYIAPEHRGYRGGRLIIECERICRELGLNKIIWHVKPKNDWSNMLRKRGYIDEDLIVGKLLR